MTNKIIYAIRVLVTLLVLVIWTIMGFVFWIPLLLKMIAYFSSMITISTFRNIQIKAAQDRLNFAIEFYVVGFVMILDILKRKKLEKIKLEDIAPVDFWDLLFSIIWDILWTVVFWGGVVFFIIFINQNY